MRDSKLKSKDLIKIRQALGGDAKATTQTARLARKLAEKTNKRNRITVGFTSPATSDLFDPMYDPESHRAVIKKGGVPIAESYLQYEKGTYPGGIVANKHGLKLGNRSGMPRPAAKVGIHSIQPAGIDLDDATSDHDLLKNKVLSRGDIRRALQKLSNRFPVADEALGYRVTGMRAQAQNFTERAVATQKMRLPKPETGMSRLEKAVRSNSSRLRGAMKGVDMLPPKLGKALARGPAGAITAPLEAGFTAYASGGGATGAATAAAATTGAGAGITAAMKRVGTLAAKHAPGLARVAGKAAVPLAVASAGYDLFRTVNEGYKAHEAATDARRNEAYMNDNYGSIEAATATRHRRQRERERTN